jgi:hypothetical protein
MSDIKSQLRKVYRLYEQGEQLRAAELADHLILENPGDDTAFQMRAFMLQASGHFKE